MVKYIKTRFLLAQISSQLVFGFLAVSSSSLGVTFAGCPDTSSDACLLRGLAIHFPSLLYSWDIWYSKIFVKCNKEMGVLMDVSPQVSPGRQTRAMHSADPFSANSPSWFKFKTWVMSIFQREKMEMVQYYQSQRVKVLT